jgi:hypothetical protein
MHPITRRVGLVLAALAVPLVLALSAVPAFAGSVPVSKTYSQFLAGYSTIFTGNTAFNDVRSDITLPSEPASVAPDSVAVGIVLQQYANSTTDTFGFGAVWADDVHVNGSAYVCDDGASAADSWVLETGHGFVQAGTPLQPSSLSPIIDNNSSTPKTVFCLPSGTSRYFLGIYDSTKSNEVSFDAGALEPGDALQVESCTYANERYHEAGIGVDTTDGPTASDLTPGTLAGFWRNGLTVLLQPKLKAGKTNSRLTFDAYDMHEFLGTADGTSSGTPSLTPGPLGVGSAFNVTANT